MGNVGVPKGLQPDNWCFMYFMRSFARRSDGTFIGYPTVLGSNYVYPMTYPISDSYVQHKFYFQRDTDIMCTLRSRIKSMSTRIRVQEFVQQYGAEKDILLNMITSQVL